MSRNEFTKTSRILAKGEYASNDTWVTGLNNNDLIVGPTGAGKTRYYVKPNLLQCNESVIVTDTKGSLVREVGPVLEERGYRVLNVDFTDVAAGDGYNPLDTVLNQPVERVWLLERGRRARTVERYDLRDHEMYDELAEASGRQEASAGDRRPSSLAHPHPLSNREVPHADERDRAATTGSRSSGSSSRCGASISA